MRELLLNSRDNRNPLLYAKELSGSNKLVIAEDTFRAISAVTFLTLLLTGAATLVFPIPAGVVLAVLVSELSLFLIAGGISYGLWFWNSSR